MTKINVSSNSIPMAASLSEKLASSPLFIKQKKLNDETISSFQLFGMRISGICLNDVEEGKLVLDIPLHAKKSAITHDDKKAVFTIGKNTVAHIELNIGKNAHNQAVVKNISLNFSRPIRIKNPSEAFEEGSKNRPLTTFIKDGLADVELKKIILQEDGQIMVDGRIEALKLFHKKLPKINASLALPSLDSHMLEQLGVLSAHEENAKARFDVKKILTTLGEITGVAPFSFKLRMAPHQLSIEKDGSTLTGGHSPLYVELNGSVDLDSKGDLHIVVKKDRQQIKSGLGKVLLGGEARLSYKDDKLLVDVAGDFDAYSSTIAIEHASIKDINKAIPLRRAVHNEMPPQTLKTFNLRLDADEVKLKGRVNLHGSVAKDEKKIEGSASANLLARNPFILSEHRGARFSGLTDVGVSLDKLSYQSSSTKPSSLVGTSGTVSVNAKADKKVLKVFPELKSLSMKYGFKVGDDGLSVLPPKHGLMRFVRPVANLEGHLERVNSAPTKQPLYPIGSEPYFKHVEKVTGARLRDAHSIKLLIDGMNSMPERLRMIGHAQESICFQALEFKNDRSGWLFAEALVEAQKRGVKVYGIIDSLGNIDSFNDLEKQNEIYRYLRENGVSLKIYNDSFEEGVRQIFNIAQSYSMFNEPPQKSLANISLLIDYIGQIAHAVDDATSPLSAEDRTKLANAIHRMMGGKEDSSPHLFVGELKEILSRPIVETNSWLLALKRLAHISYRSHEKYLVVDGHKAIIGGMNIADEYLRGGSDELIEVDGRMQRAWRDSDVLLEGDIVRDAYRCFRRNWLQIAHERLPFIAAPHGGEKNFKASMIQHRPLEDGDDNIANFFLYNLRTLQAGEKAWFETAYFLPRGALTSLKNELIAAAARGVDVRILTNSKKTSDFGALVDAARFDYRELVEAGVRVFHRTHNRMVHAKVAVLGESLTTIGSYNLDNRSSSHDSEVICAIYDHATQQKMVEQLEVDMFEQSKELTRAHLQAKSFTDEIKAAATLMLGELI